MAKIIEGIFHPRSLKMRHDLLKMRGGGAGGNGSQQLGGGAGGVGPAATVLGKTRDDIQKAFDTALGDVRKEGIRPRRTGRRGKSKYSNKALIYGPPI